VAFYVSGQLLTEDYYVANKLMKGFIGSGNIDTNSRLCMSSAVAGHKRAFGSDSVPGCYEDLELADLRGAGRIQCRLVPPGGVPAHRSGEEGAAGMKVVVIDPRAPPPPRFCNADLHLPIAPAPTPGCSTACWPSGRRRRRRPALSRGPCCDGFRAPRWRTPADRPRCSAAVASARPGFPPPTVAAFFALFTATPRGRHRLFQGINQSSRAPTRWVPSSTATSPPAGSAGPAGPVFA
jgi:assimilatory nitrate reductase catalytic subunit